MWSINKLFLLLSFCLLCLPVQAGWFGFSPKDRQEFVQARETFNRGDYQQAVVELSHYIYKTKNIKRREARAYRLLGLAYEQLGHPDKALEVYQEALEFHKKNIPILLEAASLYQRTALTDQSIELYNRVLALEPDNLEALSGQAENYIVMGFYSKARQYYDTFFQLNPQAPAVNRARYAFAFLRQRDYPNAFINITMAKLENPDDPNYWLLSARAYKGLGLMEEALADLKAASLLAPQREDLWAIASMWLYQAGKYDASLAQAQQLLKENPDNELALFMTYMNLQKKGQPEQARQQLEKIRELGHDSFAYQVANKLLAEQETTPHTRKWSRKL